MKRTPKSADAARKQILDDHRRIGQLTDRIAVFESPEEALACLEQLLPLLRRHFQEEEDEMNGLHADILARTPELHHNLIELAAEHVSLLARIEQLIAAVQKRERGIDRRALGKQLQQQLAAHEARETAIFIDSIWTDCGEGD